MSVAAFAETAAYTNLIPTWDDSREALADKQVSFNGMKWYIIRDDSNGINSGTVTLLATNVIGASQFDGRDTDQYAGSTVERYLNN